ncbi:MAG: hypothetical protein HGA87_01620 [Desulfobulbaceae bacterium]|nr:hypothetical protein [Desulfobulbaceae bacterium]
MTIEEKYTLLERIAEIANAYSRDVHLKKALLYISHTDEIGLSVSQACALYNVSVQSLIPDSKGA